MDGEINMPLKSKAQARLMYAVKNDPKVAKKFGIAPSDAEEMIEKTPKTRFKKLKEKIKKKS